MAESMAPVVENPRRMSVAHSRRSIPLFNSPKIRKSIGQALNGSPSRLDRSLDEGTMKLENNDEEELRERQRQRAAELQQQNMSSPVTPVDRRKSMGPATGMTNTAIVEHYANCIKLSAENKINVKNAFNLQLIDCMSEMLRKKDPEMNNFQAASCTLDASTKIYAYRVDCVHSDTLKMAGGLGRTAGEAQEQDQEGAAAEGDGDEEDPSKTKKKSKKKNKKTIETNKDSLNLSKFELEYDVDPLFKKNCAMLDEGRNGGVNFLSSLILKDDGCQLVWDSDSLHSSTYTRPESLQISSIPIVYGLEDSEICPPLKGFSFISWDPDDEDLIGTLLSSPTKRKLDDYQPPTLPPVSEDHAFDMDAVPDVGGGEDWVNETHIGMEDIDEDEGVDPLRNADTQPPLAVLARSGKDLGIVELKDQLTSLPQEYSYFGAAAKSAWAGPLHWRFNRPIKALPDATKDVKKKRRKDPLLLDFENTLDFGTAFNPAKGTSKLTHATLIQWLPEKVTLPEDLNFDVKEFTQSFTRPVLAVRPSKNAGSSQDLEGVLQPYDYANKRDAENFCPTFGADADGADSDNDDHHDPGSNTFAEQTADFASQDVTRTMSQFTGDNLIAAPNMVQKIQINYAKVAKKMDMRKLKTTMWNMLADKKNDAQEKPPPGNPKPFSATYHEIPTLLPTKMAENLSVALAFAALLHLANENSLQLEQKYGDLQDFVIVQPK